MSVRICENGIYRDATAEEIARMEEQKPDLSPEEPTTEEKYNALVEALTEVYADAD